MVLSIFEQLIERCFRPVEHWPPIPSAQRQSPQHIVRKGDAVIVAVTSLAIPSHINCMNSIECNPRMVNGDASTKSKTFNVNPALT